MDGNGGRQPVAESWKGTAKEWMAFYLVWNDSNALLQEIFARSFTRGLFGLGSLSMLADEFAGFLLKRNWALDVYVAVLTPGEQKRLLWDFCREKGMNPLSFSVRALERATAELRKAMGAMRIVEREVVFTMPLPRASPDAQGGAARQKQPA